MAQIEKQWAIIQQLIDGNGRIGNRLLDNEDDEALSDAFNRYFCEVGRDNNVFGEGRGEMDFSQPREKMEVFEEINVMELGVLIYSLRNTSVGVDCISDEVIKILYIYIARTKSDLVNLSLSTGTFPQILKIAKIIPFFKKGNTDLLENYRQISILNGFLKIIEEVAKSQIYAFLEKMGLFANTQFGFLTRKITTNAIMTLTKSIYSNLYIERKVMVIYLDLSKAFDRVEIVPLTP